MWRPSAVGNTVSVWGLAPRTRLASSLLDFQREECARQKVLLDVHAEIAPAMADESQMRQALLNLVRNALQAMPSGGTLSIRVGSENGSAFVRVSDTGVGITAEER